MKLITDIRQRHIEKWSLAFPEKNDDSRPFAARESDILRAAIDAGIIEGAALEDVDELRPKDARKLAGEVLTLIADSYADPN
jgi:hypothetical protein